LGPARPPERELMKAISGASGNSGARNFLVAVKNAGGILGQSRAFSLLARFQDMLLLGNARGIWVSKGLYRFCPSSRDSCMAVRNAQALLSVMGM